MSPHLFFVFVPWDASSVLRIYVEEKMWQCKADILRLEFLWHHGGVYVDADMISVGKKSLNPIVELGKVRV